MDQNFPDDEKLYRAVRPIPLFIKNDGRLSSAAFRDKRGLSVLRGDGRDDSIVDDELHHVVGLDGRTAIFKVLDCRAVHAVPVYLPSKASVYHSEVHGSEKQIILNPSQCKHLAEIAQLI